ncbi:MAG: ribonuclease R [Gammaproteobacteria bacterium]
MTDRPSWADQDPNYERELERYTSPIPSREFIRQYLIDRGRPITVDKFYRELAIHDEQEQESIYRRFEAMVKQGQLVRNRRDGYLPTEKADLIRGRVIAHPDGFGFLVPDDGSDDLFLHAKQMRMVLHGDRVVTHVRGVDRRGRREGAIVEVLERANTEVVGRLIVEQGVALVLPDNKRLTQDVVIPEGKCADAKPGQIVVALIESQPTKRTPPIGKVVEVLGEHMGPGMEIDVAIRAHNLPFRWPEEVEAEIADLGAEVPEEAKEGRVDLRNEPFVTIDGADARDFDDAVYVKKTPKGWKLWVAIADVSHYVKPGTALDEEAVNRGNSVYFPERVIPMLPEILSNGLCSLNPEVDRLAMVCEMSIDGEGAVYRSRFMRAVIRSHARLIYDDVAKLLDGDESLRTRYASLVPDLERLYELYKVLRARRELRGAIDLDTVETRIVYGEDRKIDRIEPVHRNVAHMIIEECMLAANVTTATWLERKRIPIVYRVHAGPTVEKLTDLREFLNGMGLSLGGGDDPHPGHYKNLISSISGRPDAHLIQTVLLRSMNQAVYTPENEGHFGLAYEAYTHFTSPIRRYPDLLVHRAIKHVLDGGTRSNAVYSQDDMGQFGEHSSMTERRADEATREAVSWLKCEFMLDKVGEEYVGTITAVTSFGVFVELDEVYVEGLVHVTSLDSDYYHYDPTGHRMTGERSGQVYRLGDRVKVQVTRVDLDQRKIDFAMLGPLNPGPKKKAVAPRPAEPRKGKRKDAKPGPRRDSDAPQPKPKAEETREDGPRRKRRKRKQREAQAREDGAVPSVDVGNRGSADDAAEAKAKTSGAKGDDSAPEKVTAKKAAPKKTAPKKSAPKKTAPKKVATRKKAAGKSAPKQPSGAKTGPGKVDKGATEAPVAKKTRSKGAVVATKKIADDTPRKTRRKKTSG